VSDASSAPQPVSKKGGHNRRSYEEFQNGKEENGREFKKGKDSGRFSEDAVETRGKILKKPPCDAAKDGPRGNLGGPHSRGETIYTYRASGPSKGPVSSRANHKPKKSHTVAKIPESFAPTLQPSQYAAKSTTTAELGSSKTVKGGIQGGSPLRSTIHSSGGGSLKYWKRVARGGH
jgi:hypothetical protein